MEENNNDEKVISDKAKKVAKDGAKKVGNTILKKILPKLLPVIGIFFLCLLVVGLINLVVYEITSFFTSLGGLFSSTKAADAEATEVQSVIYIEDNGTYAINDDYIDQILKNLENQKVDNDAMEFLNDIDENMLRKYIRAELRTFWPKLDTLDLELTDWLNGINGGVIIQRAKADGNIIQLSYKDYDEFCEMFDSAGNALGDNALKYFSLNPETFYLCIATRDANKGTVLSEIDYQTQIQNYALPFNFSIIMHLMSQDKDFMTELVNDVLQNSDIVMTYVENSTTTTMDYEYSGHYTTTVENDAQGELSRDNETINNSNITDYYNECKTKSVETIITGDLYVTKAYTWIANVEKKLERINNSNSEMQTTTVVNDSDENSKTTTIPTASHPILGEYVGIVEMPETTEVTETTLEETQIDEIVTTTITTSKYTLTNTVNEINVDDFIELIESYPNVENNLTSAPSNLFYLLQQNENTQKLEQIMRYVIMMLTGIDYGVDADDLQYLFADNITAANSTTSLATYLRQFSHSGEAPQSADGQFYKLYSDGEFPTIGNADLQWASNWSYFSKNGKIMHQGEVKEVENVAEYVNSVLGSSSAKYSNSEIDAMNLYIEKELVDEIGESVLQDVLEIGLDPYIEGLELELQQYYALAAIAYSRKGGTLPIINGKSFKDTYIEGLALYEKDSYQHNMYIWDNWWSKVEGGKPIHITARDAQFETYVKGVLDFSESDAGEPNYRYYYIYYTEEQLAQIDYARKIPIKRTKENEEEIFTIEYAIIFTVDTVKVGLYNFPHYLQGDYPGSYGTSTIKRGGCGPTSLAMILAGIKNDPSITPVTVVENIKLMWPDGSYYNNGSDWKIFGSDFLERYYNVTSDTGITTSEALQALEDGYPVIGREGKIGEGHILAVIPVPDEYEGQGYKFYVLDSALGHDGLYKSVDDAASKMRSGIFQFISIIYP